VRRTEEPHNTLEQVEGYVRDALALVERLEVPEDLREVAFGKCCDLIASKQLFYEQPQAMPLPPLDLSKIRH